MHRCSDPRLPPTTADACYARWQPGQKTGSGLPRWLEVLAPAPFGAARVVPASRAAASALAGLAVAVLAFAWA